MLNTSLQQVFARGVGTTAATAVCRPSEINVPVKFKSEHQEVWIKPGDYLVADLDGVVLLPSEVAAQVLDLVPGIFEANRECAKAIKDGATVQAAFKQFRGK